MIRSIGFNRLDMSGLGFCTTATIDDADASYCTTVFVSLLNLLGKYAISKWPLINHKSARPDDFHWKRMETIWIGMFRPFRILRLLSKPSLKNFLELIIWQMSDSGARGTLTDLAIMCGH